MKVQKSQNNCIGYEKSEFGDIVYTSMTEECISITSSLRG